MLLPEPTTIWQHYNGIQYEVVLIANRTSAQQDKYPTTVVYRNTLNKHVFARRADDWHRSFSPVCAHYEPPAISAACDDFKSDRGCAHERAVGGGCIL